MYIGETVEKWDEKLKSFLLYKVGKIGKWRRAMLFFVIAKIDEIFVNEGNVKLIILIFFKKKVLL